MDKPRTSWECIRFDAVRTHFVGDDEIGSLFEEEDLIRENWDTFWSIPDVYTEVPSCMQSANDHVR
jgi:hypothetical protein